MEARESLGHCAPALTLPSYPLYSAGLSLNGSGGGEGAE